ncbi:PREDICTED: uncharacterized protein LOC104596031 [Nelumbo nucifera]|uniref:Uncharacterized protein LOC104596031 n=1 Tax=Nelumbo nucifera TaxID=4432 RepID=A0A1U7ZPL9_NELNU|nr:PREDICTED: uncharacterized protein LOC104596031 [Nelumbo nucifera]
MRGVNNSMDTISAAASAIVTAEARVQPTTVQKRRWGSCWSLYWCFGSHRHGRRIGHAVLVPEPTDPGSAVPATENQSHPPSIVLPFIAPPSSPASFLQSEPPSATQSPAGLLSFTSLSANVYSPGGPGSIFAIGPYAHETQLVSPPVFSTFTTEPSTAPFTPPPEPVQLTTPSSPEVPFAKLLTSSLDPNHRAGEACQNFPVSQYEFQSYQLYPGSPVGHLISPSSAISGSGTSSPFPDRELISGEHSFLEFRASDPPKLFSIDALSILKGGQGQGSGSLTPDAAGPTSRDGFPQDNQISEVASLANSDSGSQNGDIVIDHRVSFELTTGEVPSCVEKAILDESISQSLPSGTTAEVDGISRKTEDVAETRIGETSNNTPQKSMEDGEEQRQHHHQKNPSLTLGSVKEFNFDNADGGAADKPTISSEWWINQKEARPCNQWTFFPMMQPGVS